MIAALVAPPATKTGAGPRRPAASPASAKPTGSSAAGRWARLDDEAGQLAELPARVAQ